MNDKTSSSKSKKKNASRNDLTVELLSQIKIRDIIAQKAHEILLREGHEPRNTSD